MYIWDISFIKTIRFLFFPNVLTSTFFIKIKMFSRPVSDPLLPGTFSDSLSEVPHFTRFYMHSTGPQVETEDSTHWESLSEV